MSAVVDHSHSSSADTSWPDPRNPWIADYPTWPEDDLLPRIHWDGKSRLTAIQQKQLRDFYKGNWNAFPDAPGTHIRRERAGGNQRFTLVARDAEFLATLQDGSAWPNMIMLRSIHVDGETYQVRVQGSRLIKAFSLGFRESPDAELIGRSNGSTVLRVSGRHHAGESNAVVTFSDGRRFCYPIIGTGLQDEVMTAVDQNGNKAIRYRKSRRTQQTRSAAKIEVVVNPAFEVTSDLLLLIAISSGFLLTEYRRRPGGGGG